MENPFAELAGKMPTIIRNAVLGSGQNLQTNIITRIFPSSGQSVDADGVLVKNGEGYGKGYAEYRRSKGKQIANIDLQFEGNLLRSVVNNEDKDEYTILFNSSTQTDKAIELEQRWKQDIFSASDLESDEAIADFERLFFQQIDEVF